MLVQARQQAHDARHIHARHDMVSLEAKPDIRIAEPTPLHDLCVRRPESPHSLHRFCIRPTYLDRTLTKLSAEVSA